MTDFPRSKIDFQEIDILKIDFLNFLSNPTKEKIFTVCEMGNIDFAFYC